jgi:hypothetical protein
MPSVRLTACPAPRRQSVRKHNDAPELGREAASPVLDQGRREHGLGVGDEVDLDDEIEGDMRVGLE